jgi:Domain of unknown function (DUF4349)/PKD domain
VSPKKIILLVLVILIGGVVVGLTGIGLSTPAGTFGTFNPPAAGSSFGSNSQTSGGGYSQGIGNGSNGPLVVQGGGTTVVQQVTTVEASSSGTIVSETQSQPSTVSINSGTPDSTKPPSSTSSVPTPEANRTGFVEFFSNVTVQVNSAQNALNKATAISYTYGGYPAYSSYNNLSSIAVLRIPAQNYGIALSQIEGLGNLTGLQTNSNDVSIQYTDLNSTLQSLFTEQASLLKLENQSNSLNSTLLLESQIQGIDARINEIQSQILQTRLLIDYSTITATFNIKVSGPPPLPLAMRLTATPTSGLNPLSVTFNAIVTGGKPDYIVNYNFGDGTSYQGQTLIHTFTQSGVFNVSVTVTDSSGSAIANYSIIHVSNPPTASQFSSFASNVGGLLVSVVEGIVEVAVVILPIALVIGAVILPFRNRMRATKKQEIKS